MLASKKEFAIVFDIDGVLIHDGTVIDGVPEIIKSLHDHHIPFVFVTNGGGETESERAGRLSKLFGLTIDPSRVIMAHTPLTKRSLFGNEEKPSEESNERVLFIGRDDVSCDKILENYGYSNRVSLRKFAEKHPYLLPYSMKEHENYYKFSHEEQLKNSENDRIDSIFFLDTPIDWLETLQLTCDLLLSDGRVGHLLDFSRDEQKVKVCFCNPDLVYQGVCSQPRFTMGAFRYVFLITSRSCC